MTLWQLGSAAFLGYVLLIGLLPRGLPPGRRRRIFAGVTLGLAVVVLSAQVPSDAAVNVWILPPALLLIGYWTSGLLFVAPMPAAERVLASVDARLRIQPLAARLPAPVVELLEFSYSGVYALIPIALYLALRQGVTVDRFWSVVLFTDYACFGTLPWIQTRPPRAVGLAAPWRSRWRAVNHVILDASSVQVNTFPSGHAAEALACALLVAHGPAPVVAWMFFNVAAISAGAVFGRYHYAADAVAGWVVATVVFWSIT